MAINRHSKRLRGKNFHQLEVKEITYSANHFVKKNKFVSKVAEFILDYPFNGKILTLHPTKGYKLMAK